LRKPLGKYSLLATRVFAEELPRTPLDADLQSVPWQIGQRPLVMAVYVFGTLAAGWTLARRLTAFHLQRGHAFAEVHGTTTKRLGMR